MDTQRRTAAGHLGFLKLPPVTRQTDGENEGAAPEEAAQYWARFDELQADLGTEWLAWMGRLWEQARTQLLDRPGIFSADLFAADERLIAEWTGTADAPGPLTALVLAGMAAGIEAVEDNKAADYRAVVEQVIDFDLLSQEALDFVNSYLFDLIKDINATTVQKLQQIIAAWLESGEPVSVLETQLEGVFNDKNRAKLIARTESARAYNEGTYNRYEAAGVTEATWQTVRDAMVCPICRRLHNQVASFRAGWVHPGGSGDEAKFAGKTYRPPAHPQCRCFTRPYVRNL